MNREWEYSNLVSEAYECGGPDLYKEALYDAGKQDGTKAGFIVGTIGVLVALAFKENDIAAKMYGAAPGSTIPSLDAELGYRECRE